MISNLGDPRTATAAACAIGLTTIGTELGGGGTVRPDVLSLCRRGIRNVLTHLGVLPGDRTSEARSSARPIYELPGSSAFVYATADGIFEPYHPNGAEVHTGEPASRRGILRSFTTMPMELSMVDASPAAYDPAIAAWWLPRRGKAQSEAPASFSPKRARFAARRLTHCGCWRTRGSTILGGSRPRMTSITA